MSENNYTGNINIYFPCQLKGNVSLKSFHKMWKRCRIRQMHDVHRRKHPLTDLMDLEAYRNEKESILTYLQDKIDVFGNAHLDDAPYALKCLQESYRKIREDNLFSKNVSVVISHFVIEYEGLKDTEGTLLYNVNADNNIATYVLILHFDNFSVDEIVLLKHLFYKRLEIFIQEYEIQYGECTFSYWDSGACFGCMSKSVKGKQRKYSSFQEYIAEKELYQRFAEKIDTDYRARYSLVELRNHAFGKPNYKDIYGIMCADEGYKYLSRHVQEQMFRFNLSVREAYAYYQCGLNGLIVNKYTYERIRCKENHADFEKRYHENEEHIKTFPIKCHCIAGVMEEFFPAYLKAVELHFLINNVQTSETEENDKSYINPFIFILRSIKLWKILYELDVNKYHIHEKMHEAFGIKNKINEIREEYKIILQHTMNYVILLFTIMQVIMAVITIYIRK